jgi:hypothetical protein
MSNPDEMMPSGEKIVMLVSLDSAADSSDPISLTPNRNLLNPAEPLLSA